MSEEPVYLKLKEPITVHYFEEDVTYPYFEVTSFADNGALAVLLTDRKGESYDSVVLSVNLDASDHLDKDKFFLDVNNLDEGLIKQLLDNKYIENTGMSAPSGFVVYPCVKANLLKMCEKA